MWHNLLKSRPQAIRKGSYMSISREDIVREIGVMLNRLRDDSVSEAEIARKEHSLKNEMMLDCLEFLLNRPDAAEMLKYSFKSPADYPIESLKLSTRPYRALRRCGTIQTVADLLELPDAQLRKIRGIGSAAYIEIQERLRVFKKEHGLTV